MFSFTIIPFLLKFRSKQMVVSPQNDQHRFASIIKQLWEDLSSPVIYNSIKPMSFDLWFAYYDSLFIMSSPSLPRHFFLIKTINSIQWHYPPCPALAECFALLEAFLKCNENWVTSRCTSEELNSISENLNILLHFLKLEKLYSIEFWKEDIRRVQASVTHLYCFLQNLIKAIIPYPTMTIFQCKAALKLCVDINKLQALFNCILKKLNSIAAFLSSPRFNEESSLIINFFDNMVSFMQRLPKIKRSQINHVHNLTKYVILCNPLEICIRIKSKVRTSHRKRSTTIGTIRDLDRKTADAVIMGDHKPNTNYINFQGYLCQVRKRSSSCVCLGKNQKDQPKQLVKLFQFPDRIKKEANEVIIVNKKKTLESFKTLTTKVNSFSKDKSSSIASIITPLTGKRIKVGSAGMDLLTPTRTKNQTQKRKRKKSYSRFYDDEEERFELNSINNLIQINGLKIQSGKIRRVLDERQISEKNTRVQRQKGIIKFFQAHNGDKIFKKWDLVRNYFWNNVRKRKMQKLLKSQSFF